MATTGWVVVAGGEDGTPSDHAVPMIGVAASDGVRTKIEGGRCEDTLGEKASKARKPSEHFAEIVVVYFPELGCQTGERS